MRTCEGLLGPHNRSERFFSSERARYCSDCLSEARRRAAKARNLRERYGITLGEFEALKDAQRGYDNEVCCAGCHETRGDTYRWSVDHDHKIAETEGLRASIRGLLCRRCNKVLRDIRDNVQLLGFLQDYLHWQRERSQLVLAGKGRDA